MDEMFEDEVFGDEVFGDETFDDEMVEDDGSDDIMLDHDMFGIYNIFFDVCIDFNYGR